MITKMNEEQTFGEFIVAKRRQHDLTARELAIKLKISAVYLCDIEKGRKAAISDETLDSIRCIFDLNESETELLYDLAAKARNTVSADLPEYIMEKDIVRAALRTAKKNNITDKQWEDFIKRITKKED
jgi:transcriptional regulator with XRE-family HTH domain